MITKDLLRQIVHQQKSAHFPVLGTVKREILGEVLRWFKDNRIIILTGVRRCGKSTLLRQIMREKTDFCYVNFEDERFIDFKAQDFEVLNEVLIEVYENPQIYFFDEVQNIEKFETFVRRLQDQGKKVVITGSNATLLSKEFGTRLTGRYKSFEVYPFSFREFFAFMGIKPEKNWVYLSDKKVELIRIFAEYLHKGGFPEFLQNGDIEYVRTIYENILYRDIISRYAIRKQRILKELVNILITNISSSVTYNSLKKDVGLSNAITVKEYISYLSNSYLFFELLKFDFSVRKQLNAPRKIYVIDAVFNLIMGQNFSMNNGKILENVVFVELKRRKNEVFYYKNKYECDFVIKEETKIQSIIQVCWQLNENNKEREINGLLEAMTKFNLSEGRILTYEQEDEIKVENKKIKILPVWKWLLECFIFKPRAKFGTTF